MLPYDSERVVEAAEDLADSASASLFRAWAIGVVVAFVLAVYGVRCIGTRSAHFIEGKPAHLVTYHGGRGVAIGVAHLCAGVFLNLHFFWSWRDRYRTYAQIGKVIALLGLAGAICYFVFSVLVLG